NRLDEYTPWPAKALSEQFADFGGKGFGYAAFLTAELKPYIDRAYRTDSRPQSTGMIGASLGGLISLYTAYLYPNVIGRIGSISGSLWYEDFIDFMQTEKIDYSDLKVYMDVGSEEGSGKQSIQKDMVPNTRRAHAILAGIGLTGDRLRFVEEEGMPHGPAFFVKRFPEAVKWLFAGE
ncbi:alpha/beta hydrolase, partial [Paenibacillus sepulcri]|nr:alpha/beta hydrolase [Paenibacillus sepulcri]